MLKITVQDSAEGAVLVLEGRLVGPWVAELERVCSEQNALKSAQRLAIDLCELTGMDNAGELLLRELYERGAALRCSDVMNRYLVERMTGATGKPLEGVSRPCHSAEAEAS